MCVCAALPSEACSYVCNGVMLFGGVVNVVYIDLLFDNTDFFKTKKWA